MIFFQIAQSTYSFTGSCGGVHLGALGEISYTCLQTDKPQCVGHSVLIEMTHAQWETEATVKTLFNCSDLSAVLSYCWRSNNRQQTRETSDVAGVFLFLILSSRESLDVIFVAVISRISTDDKSKRWNLFLLALFQAEVRRHANEFLSSFIFF